VLVVLYDDTGCAAWAPYGGRIEMPTRLLALRQGRKLTYVYNFLGIPPEQKIVADTPTSGTHIVGVDFDSSPGSRDRPRLADG